MWRTNTGKNDYPYLHSKGTLLKEPSKYPQLTVSYFGPGGKLKHTVFDQDLFNAHLNYLLIDRWVAFNIIANEVEVIEEAIQAAPDYKELYAELEKNERLLYKLTVEMSGLKLEQRQAMTFDDLSINTEEERKFFTGYWVKIAEDDFDEVYGDNPEI